MHWRLSWWLWFMTLLWYLLLVKLSLVMIAVCNIWRYNQWKKGFVVDEIVLTRTETFFIAPQLLVLHYFYFFKSLVDNSEMTDNSKKWQQMKKSVVISNKVMETSTCCFLFGWKTTSGPFFHCLFDHQSLLAPSPYLLSCFYLVFNIWSL
jgi:hypothetical protein